MFRSTAITVLAIVASGFAGSSASGESYSSIYVVTPPRIDDNGYIRSGSGSGGEAGRIVGKARLSTDNNGIAWWEADYSNIYGSVERRRAPGHDQPVSVRFIIDPNSSEAALVKFVGSTAVDKQHLGWAELQYANDGRAYFDFQGNLAWANRPPRVAQQQFTVSTGQTGQAPEYKTHVNRRTGQVFKRAFVDGKQVDERLVGQATLQQAPNGFFYWTSPGLRPVLRM